MLEGASEIAVYEPLIVSKFCRPFRQYPLGYRVERLANDAGFELGEKEIRLSRGGIDLLMRSVSRAEINRPLRDDVRRVLVELYVLHEARHISQGIAHFGSVQDVKKIAGLQTLGELDLIADIEAARVLSAVQLMRQGRQGRLKFLRLMRNNLFVMGEFALKAFKAPLDKPHKVHRALGIAAATARLDSALTNGNTEWIEENQVPLDAALWPVFTSMDAIALLTLTPERGVLCARVAVDPAEFAALCEGIDEQPFDVSVTGVGRILRRARMIA